MQIVIDKENLINMIAIVFYATNGGEYEETKRIVQEIIEKIEYKALPKGHGRLIDADKLKEEMYTCETNGRSFYIMELHERLAVIDDAPTIIEADIEIVEDHENA